MGKNRATVQFAGFGRSALHTLTIPLGNTGANLGTLDLGRNYAYLVVKCLNAAGIASGTSLSAQVGYDDDDALCTLYEKDDPTTAWSKGSLPTSGSFAFLLLHAFGAQRLHLLLSKNTTAAVTFQVYGLAESVQG
jgi:hypothetical protein